MSRRSESFFSIGRKLGLIFTVLTVLLLAFGAVVVVELTGIREDAAQLLEEHREAALSAELCLEIEVLGSQLAVHRLAGADATVAAAAEAAVRARLASARAVLALLERGPADRADPSRAEHQAAESRLVATIREEMADVEAELDGASSGPGERSLERSSGYAGVLAAETREEAAHANDDLVERARTATLVLAVAALTVGAALCLALWYVRRAVVVPLRTLERHTAHVVAGTALPASPLAHARDEIGALTRAFEDMALRVASTQSALQRRVEQRTRELMRAARFADIGVLAAGVAHEINNPLASIASCAEGLERRVRNGGVDRDEELDYLRTIASEAWRAKDITARLLALARQDHRADARVDLAGVARQLVPMTRHQMEAREVRLELEAPEQGPFVAGDAGELLQLLVNLVMNARDATPAGGEVRVSLGRAGDGAVEILVDDAGPGVPDAIAARIFDPFFTTKQPGEGTGLGLALVASIVESHRGSIAVERSPAGGARFRVRLAAAAEDAP